jgi:tRNA1Val (adenine37-N6)-methyltransferase
MSETTFRFRQFTIHQDKCAMKVGTDAVLLGAWVNANGAQRILDIGSGTGIIALMIAQKSSGQIHAVDIDEGAFHQCKENFRLSPWNERLLPYHVSFQEFASSAPTSYDLVVSNPPYFHHASKPPEELRSQARHHDQLTFEDLLTGTKKILSPEGKLCVILPIREGMEFMDIAMRHGLFCQRMMKVKTKQDRPEKRIMMEFTTRFGVMDETSLVIHDAIDQFSEEYRKLTVDYYL